MLEMMLVYAVATVLCIRAFLALTGYPQLGGGGLHIAHMLWGGLGMLVSIAILLSFWNPAMRELAASIGGIGFGFFIDELGKFITSDNNYFFQPTIALIYMVFVLMFIIVGALRARPLTAMELSANKNIITAVSSEGTGTRLSRIYADIDGRVQSLYRHVVQTRWFVPALSLGFIVTAVGQIVTIVSLVFGRHEAAPANRSVPLLENAAAVASAACIVVGVLFLRRSRLTAYSWFLRSTLITILVTQVFMFYYSEWAALGGLFVHLSLYFMLRILILQEKGTTTPAAQR